MDTGGGFAVAVFFVLSGYLITASYQNSRNALTYLWKRLLRLVPALAASVLLCAFIIGPMVTTMSMTDYFADPLLGEYLKNLYLQVHYDLPGVFAQNAYPRAVNGSIWTMPIEFLMYLIVLVLGALGCLTPRWVAAVIGVFWLLKFKLLPAFGANDLILAKAMVAQDTAKLGAIFFSGSYLYLVRDRFTPRVEHVLLGLCVLTATGFTGASTAIFMAVMPLLVIWFAFAPVRWFNHFGKYGDFSYGIYIYAFPVQQLTVHLFANSLGPVQLFFVSFVPTLLLAAVSWHLIENPALQLKRFFAPKLSSLRKPETIRIPEVSPMPRQDRG